GNGAPTRDLICPAELTVKPPVEYPQIVETAPPVPLCTAEEDDMIAERPADFARAVLPSLSFQGLSVHQTPVGPGVIEFLVLVKHIKEVLQGSLPRIECLQDCEAFLLK